MAAPGSAILKRLSGRPQNSLDAEREEFLKQMAIAMTKAINKEETAVKEKHLRITILGTHKEHGANYFWDNVLRLQVEGHPIVAWKFCHVFHKIVLEVMREGHPNVLRDSKKFQGKIKDLGKYWGHLPDGYGRLIMQYCKLLLNKMEFHSRNPEFPGNLVLSDQAMMSLGDGDVNNWFQIAIEALDYVDEIIALQRKVFDSMDMGRANSLTNMGQCRLAPLILCIQDASCLYDYLVKILFALHARLPKDVLGGHRDRFALIFRGLKQFFATSSNLQYYKHLVSIPPLPEQPPNFLVASEFDSYVPFRVTVHGNDDDRESVFSDTLVDFAASVPSPQPPPPTDTNGDDALEKEAIITSLRHDLDDTKALLHRLRNEFSGSLDQAQNRALQLEHELAQSRDHVEALAEENERYRAQAETMQNESNSQTAAKLEESEKKAQSNEEKFHKMKEVYGKLREEHIAVLGRLGALQKEVEAGRKGTADAEDAARQAQHRLEALQLQQAQLQQRDSDERAAESSRLADLQARIHQLQTKLSESESSAAARESEASSKIAEAEERSSELTLQFQRAQASVASLEGSIMDACLDMLREAGEECEEPAHMSVACSPEFVLTLTQPLNGRVEESGGPLLAHGLAHLISFLSSTARAAPGNKGPPLEAAAKRLLASATNVYETKKAGGDACAAMEELRSALRESEELVRGLLGTMGDVSKDELGGLMEAEMKAMGAAIQAAAAKIADITARSKSQHSGIRVEVNDSILQACTALMQAVLILVSRSRDLQEEIVAQGKGQGSTQEFYKRHHQWTEGLLSAAKNVGLAAHVLVTAADRAISGEGKLEEVMAASQEIAAATAQLVVASRVKADRDSARLAALTTASKDVSSATASVIGTVKSGRQTLEEEEALDFSKYTVHESKKMEMESQVRVLELECELEKERRRLGQLRKNNYRSDDSKEDTPAP